MIALKFDLLGKTAHFKNPENNSKLEVSYDNIPRTALIGALGAIIGLKGKQQEREIGYVEYWEELKNTKIAIVPHAARFRKHLNELTNSTGFGNSGETQIVRMQILENVRWTIYVLKDSMKKEHWNKLIEMLKARKSTYSLYLGKTEFKARLGSVEEIVLENIKHEDIRKCDSLLKDKYIAEMGREKEETHKLVNEDLFIRRDYMPNDYDKNRIYILEKMIFTNSIIEVESGEFAKDSDIIINLF